MSFFPSRTDFNFSSLTETQKGLLARPASCGLGLEEALRHVLCDDDAADSVAADNMLFASLKVIYEQMLFKPLAHSFSFAVPNEAASGTL